MPTFVKCSACGKSSDLTVLSALDALSATGRIGTCTRLKCGKPLRLEGSHFYANLQEERKFKVVAAVKSGPDEVRYTVFLEALQFSEPDEHFEVSAQFWAPNAKGNMAYGQFSPIMNFTDWERLLKQLRRRVAALSPSPADHD